MAHNDPMTWRQNEKRWTKWYRGKTFNVSPRKLITAGLLSSDTPPTKDATRSAMRAWWKQTEAELTAELEAAREPQPPTGVYLSGVGVEFSENGEAEQHKIRMRIKKQVTDPDGALADHVRKLINDGKQQLQHFHSDPPVDSSVGANVTTFLEFKRSQADAGERTIDRVDGLRIHLEHFVRWFGDAESIDGISEATVDTYYRYVLGEARKNNISKYYARDLFASFRQFVRWLASRRRVAMPYNLNSREFGFKLQGKVKTFTDSEIELLLHSATDRTKLYMLLMLNTGATQVDIAELSKDSLDLQNGQLTRKRFKTEDHQNVPTVIYPLWPETLRLLKTHLNPNSSIVNRHGEPLALVSSDEKTLLTKTHNAKGQLTKTDVIRSAFNRVIRKLKNSGIPIEGSLKLFRKTAASKLEAHPSHGRYVVHFLGQSPDTVAGRHYVTPDAKQFAEAVVWLGEQWNLRGNRFSDVHYV